MKTLQEQYNLILEGKGDKDFFMKSARRIFPQHINQYTSFNDATKILKSKSILTERFIGGLVTQSDKKPDWFKIFDENINEAKAIESKPTKEVVDMETRGFDYKDPKNIDNVFGPQFLTGYYAEMKDPKNSEKTVEELKAIVAKNLAKDIMYYTKDGQFGVKGLGYKESTPTKEVKGKYKAAGVEPAPKIVKESKLREHISRIIKEELVNEISPELFKRATDVSRERGQNQRTSSMGEAFFSKFKGKPLMGGTITNIRYVKPSSELGDYEQVIVEIEVPSSVVPGETKSRYIYYDVKTDQWDINKEITRADARVFSLIAQHINPDTQYKSGGVGFDIKGY